MGAPYGHVGGALHGNGAGVAVAVGMGVAVGLNPKGVGVGVCVTNPGGTGVAVGAAVGVGVPVGDRPGKMNWKTTLSQLRNDWDSVGAPSLTAITGIVTITL